MQRDTLKYKVPESLAFHEETSFYTKPPRKFVGYFQFANSRPAAASQQAAGTASVGRRMTDSKSVPTLLEDSRYKTFHTFHQQQSGRPKRLRGRGADSAGQPNIAQLIQEQFIKTHSKRLTKIPSFLSSHMSRFTTSNVLGEVTSPHSESHQQSFAAAASSRPRGLQASARPGLLPSLSAREDQLGASLATSRREAARRTRRARRRPAPALRSRQSGLDRPRTVQLDHQPVQSAAEPSPAQS